MLNNGVYTVSANMPTVPDGVEQFVSAGILYGLAANAGGVATPAWRCPRTACGSRDPRGGGRPAPRHRRRSTSRPRTPPRSTYSPGNYVNGANIAGFVKVAEAMLDQGGSAATTWGSWRAHQRPLAVLRRAPSGYNVPFPTVGPEQGVPHVKKIEATSSRSTSIRSPRRWRSRASSG